MLTYNRNRPTPLEIFRQVPYTFPDTHSEQGGTWHTQSYGRTLTGLGSLYKPGRPKTQEAMCTC